MVYIRYIFGYMTQRLRWNKQKDYYKSQCSYYPYLACIFTSWSLSLVLYAFSPNHTCCLRHTLTKHWMVIFQKSKIQSNRLIERTLKGQQCLNLHCGACQFLNRCNPFTCRSIISDTGEDHCKYLTVLHIAPVTK